MTPTERLRELLDERGIEHYDHENGEPLRVLEKAEEPATSWRVDGVSYCAVPDGKGTFDVWVDHCTPEQAVFGVAMPESDAGGAFDSERYSKVCRLLEDALTTMSEWGT